MRKSCEDFSHLIVEGKTYPLRLPDLLHKWQIYHLEKGHCILCVRREDLNLARKEGMDNYEIPIPVKTVLRLGYRIQDGYVVVEGTTFNDDGLIIPEEEEEF
jgi:hypothetical protein